jgi:hypothetical protein
MINDIRADGGLFCHDYRSDTAGYGGKDALGCGIPRGSFAAVFSSCRMGIGKFFVLGIYLDARCAQPSL